MNVMSKKHDFSQFLSRIGSDQEDSLIVITDNQRSYMIAKAIQDVAREENKSCGIRRRYYGRVEYFVSDPMDEAGLSGPLSFYQEKEVTGSVDCDSLKSFYISLEDLEEDLKKVREKVKMTRS